MGTSDKCLSVSWVTETEGSVGLGTSVYEQMTIQSYLELE